MSTPFRLRRDPAHPLDQQQRDYLRRLYRAGAISPATAVGRTVIGRSISVFTLGSLAARGLVAKTMRRQPSPLNTYWLTAAGVKAATEDNPSAPVRTLSRTAAA